MFCMTPIDACCNLRIDIRLGAGLRLGFVKLSCKF